MPYSFIVTVKLGYIYLFVLAMLVIIRTIGLSAKLSKSNKNYSDLLHIIVVTIMLLGITLCYQCIGLIRSPISINSWWVPFICKHMTLIVFHASISTLHSKIKDGAVKEIYTCPIDKE